MTLPRSSQLNKVKISLPGGCAIGARPIDIHLDGLRKLGASFSINNGYIIGEIACGHEGDINKFKRLIDCIAESGAQIIKFQIFTPLERATVDHSEWKIFND